MGVLRCSIYLGGGGNRICTYGINKHPFSMQNETSPKKKLKEKKPMLPCRIWGEKSTIQNQAALSLFVDPKISQCHKPHPEKFLIAADVSDSLATFEPFSGPAGSTDWILVPAPAPPCSRFVFAPDIFSYHGLVE